MKKILLTAMLIVATFTLTACEDECCEDTGGTTKTDTSTPVEEETTEVTVVTTDPNTGETTETVINVGCGY